jgi:hypothetical protein
VRSSVPHSLEADEEVLLRHLLSVDFVGVQRLREQMDHCQVFAYWSQEGLSVDLRVSDPAAVPAAVPDGPTQVRAYVLDATGQMTGELVLWFEGGLMPALEYTWTTDRPPVRLPAPGEVDIVMGRGPLLKGSCRYAEDL